MPKPPPEIPRAELREGARRCLDLVASRLDETIALLNANLVSQAGVVFSFAVEEFGKAVSLRRAYDSGQDPVKPDGFYDHAAKLADAATVVPAQYLLLAEREFDPEEFSSEFAIEDVPVAVASRWNALFVDWKEPGAWTEPVEVDRATILKSIGGVRDRLSIPLDGWA